MGEWRVHAAPASDEFLRLRRTLEVPSGPPPTRLREERWAFRAWASRLQLSPDVVVEPAEGMPERGTEWVRPIGADVRQDVILYLHGGGFRVGAPSTARSITSHLSAACGLELLSTAYPLAPEAAIDDMVASAVRTLHALRAERPRARVVLAGDSAGGYLALALVAELERRGEPLPAAVVLFCPLTAIDARAEGEREIRDPMLNEEMLTAVRRDARPRRARRLAVAPAPAKAAPPDAAAVPMLIQYGGLELLAGSIESFAERARPGRERMLVEEWCHAFHVWHLFAGMLPESDAAIASASAFVRDALR
ncbi:alpha/beta hydrolase [Agromyces sp. NPDC058126]|uniref:alpha/beta hydrolase n=1 Tax=Agromyces sp. NPDC058126 TaxID=3346350 RepID=UPI0036DCEC44